jgi:HPr kinase/phosphorylase
VGLDPCYSQLLGTRTPMTRRPVAPGPNVAILVYVAARNLLPGARGHHAARRLTERLHQQLENLATPGEPELEYGEDL